MLRRTALLALAMLCALAVPSARAHAAVHTWAAYEIGPIDPCVNDPDACDDDNTAWDINSNGWVAGDAFPDNHWPWVWKEGATPALITPGHTTSGDFSDTGFQAINTNGDTVGYTSNQEGGFPTETHALLYKGGVFTDLGTLEGQTGNAWAYGVNDADTVVGASTTSAGTDYHGFVWTQATGMVDLGTLGGSDSWANSVNSSNQIVGWADDSGGAEHAFLDQSGHMTDLGTLGGDDSEATSINASGEIVGWADTMAGKQDAFIRAGSTLTDIGKLLTDATSSVANDVDNNGDVVGTAETPTGDYSWLYIGGKMVNLDKNTVTCCDETPTGGALNKTLQIVPRDDTDSAVIPVLEPVTAYDENNAAIKYTGKWTRTAKSGAWGAFIKSTTAKGATATLKFKGKRIWWTADVESTSGTAKVYLDGSLQTTVDLGDSDPGYVYLSGPRSPVYVHSFATVGSHTIKIVVNATAGQPTVSVDAFAVSQH